MLATLLDHLRTNRDFTANVVAWERIPPRPARYAHAYHTCPPECNHVHYVDTLDNALAATLTPRLPHTDHVPYYPAHCQTISLYGRT